MLEVLELEQGLGNSTGDSIGNKLELENSLVILIARDTVPLAMVGRGKPIGIVKPFCPEIIGKERLHVAWK